MIITGRASYRAWPGAGAAHSSFGHAAAADDALEHLLFSGASTLSAHKQAERLMSGL
ncbi:MAG TPA: hypothetical protein VGC66_20305 [Pyrinomonadaceae bacterium]